MDEPFKGSHRVDAEIVTPAKNCFTFQYLRGEMAPFAEMAPPLDTRSRNRRSWRNFTNASIHFALSSDSSTLSLSFNTSLLRL